MTLNTLQKKIILFGSLLTTLTLLLAFWLPFQNAFRIVFGSVYLLLVPGFSWTWVFWAKNEINSLERGILSLIISLMIVPLLVFLLNKVGVRIILVNILLEILLLIVIAVIIRLIILKKS